MVSKILNYPTDGHTMADELPQQEDMLQAHMGMSAGNARQFEHLKHRSAGSMEWVDEVILANKAFVSTVRRSMNTARQALALKGFEPVPHLLRINSKFKLGGVLVLQDDNTKHLADDEEPEWDSRDVMMRLIAGIHISPKNDPGVMYKPPFLRYAYAPETPVMLEGSILKNVLVGVEKVAGFAPAGADEAWEVARRCGLPEEFLHAPDTFSVGKGGRNLPVSVRQILSIVRVILTNADVVMLHKPTALLNADEARLVNNALKQYADYGGLWGMLDPEEAKKQGKSATHFLTGNGTRTVIMTMSHRERATVPDVASGIIKCEAFWTHED